MYSRYLFLLIINFSFLLILSCGDFKKNSDKVNSAIESIKIWTKQLGTSSYDVANGVATDSSGNIYVTGETQGGLDGNTSAGGSDLFLVKYNSSGKKQ